MPTWPRWGTWGTARAGGLDDLYEEEQLLTPEQRQSLLGKAGGKLLSGLSATANVLDLPGSTMRDLLTWMPGGTPAQNPLDQWLDPLGSHADTNRVEGRDLLRGAGLIGEQDTWGNFWSGLGVDILSDPTTFLGVMGLIGKAGKLAKSMDVLGDVSKVAAKKLGTSAGRKLGWREAGMNVSLQDLIDEGKIVGDDLASLQHLPTQELQRPLVGSWRAYGPAAAVLGPGGGTGPVSQSLARGLDTAGDWLRYSTPVRYAHSLLDKKTFGATTADAQRLTPDVYRSKEAAETSARADVADILADDAATTPDGETFADFFDLGRIEKKLAAAAPGADAAQIAADSQRLLTARANDAFRYIEHVGDAAARPLPPELAPFQQQFDQIRELYQQQRAAEFDTPGVDDIFADYMARLRVTFPGGSVFAPSRGVSIRNRHELARLPFLKDLREGTAVVQDLSVDPEFSGIAHVAAKSVGGPGLDDLAALDKTVGALDQPFAPGTPKLPNAEVKARVELLKRKYGDRLMLQAGQSVIGPSDEQLQELVRWLATLDPRHAAEQIPVFERNPLLAMQRRLEVGRSVTEVAKGLARGAVDMAAPRAAGAADRAMTLADMADRMWARTAEGGKAPEAFLKYMADQLRANPNTAALADEAAVVSDEAYQMALAEAERTMTEQADDMLAGFSSRFTDAEKKVKAVFDKAKRGQTLWKRFTDQDAGMPAFVRLAEELQVSLQAGLTESADTARQQLLSFMDDLGIGWRNVDGTLTETPELQAFRGGRELSDPLIQDAIDAFGRVATDMVDDSADPAVAKALRKQVAKIVDKTKKRMKALSRQATQQTPGLPLYTPPEQTLFDQFAAPPDLPGELSLSDQFAPPPARPTGSPPRPLDPHRFDQMKQALLLLEQGRQQVQKILNRELGYVDPRRFTDRIFRDLQSAAAAAAHKQRLLGQRIAKAFGGDALEPDNYSGALEQAAESLGRAQTIDEVDLDKLQQGILDAFQQQNTRLTDHARSRATAAAAATPTTSSRDLLKQVWVPEDSAADVISIMKGHLDPQQIHPVMDAIDRFTNVFRSLATSPWPAYQFRNLSSGQINNAMAGAWDPRSFIDSVRLILGGQSRFGAKTVRGLAKQIPDFADLTDEEATKRLKQELFAHDVPSLRHGQHVSEGGRATKRLLGDDELFPAPTGLSTLDKLNPLNPETFTPTRRGGQLGDVVEKWNRTTAYIALRKKGWSPAAAARRATAIQVDYRGGGSLDPALRRIFPFWSFQKGAGHFLINELLDRPGGAYGQTFRAINRARDPNELTPDYVAETAAIPVPGGPEGGNRYITGLGLMMEDPASFMPAPGSGLQGTLLEAGSRLNPLIKAPLEWMTGETFFQKGPTGGRELEDLDPTLGRTITSMGVLAKDPRAFLFGSEAEQPDAVRLPQAIEFGVMQSPLSRAATTLRTLVDPRKSLLAKGVNLTTGIRLADVSPAAQDALLQERAADLLKDLGGREFTKPYFPKDRKIRLTPEDLAKVESLEAILSELDQRKKLRAKLRRKQAYGGTN